MFKIQLLANCLPIAGQLLAKLSIANRLPTACQLLAGDKGTQRPPLLSKVNLSKGHKPCIETILNV